jgi:tetratricopeptide (TPR) repeat protein
VLQTPDAHRTLLLAPVQRARAALVFVGRERELAELLAGLDDAMSGGGRLFLLAGEPGIGKSRLADEAATRARQRGVRVAWGRCWEAGGAPAYWPWVQSLRAYVRDADPEILRSRLGAGAPFVTQLLPELADVPAPSPLEGEAGRFRLFDAVAGFLRNAATDQPRMLVLDDLQAADTPSLLLLQFVARELSDMRILAVGAYRNVELGRDHPLTFALAGLSREQATRHLPLLGLAEADVARLIQETAGITPPARLVRAIHRETEGNPLFVSEVVRLLAAEGSLAEMHDPRPLHLAIPDGIRDAIGRRLRRLSDECVRLLSLASIFGREFGLDALERLAGQPSEQLLAVLEEAEAARVVVDVPGTLGRMRFGHGLIRDGLDEEIPTGHWLRLHRQAGEALEALYKQRPGQHLAELAHHFFPAAPGGDAGKTVDYARSAGDQAASQLAYEEAVRLYRMALAVLDTSATPDEPGRCELLAACPRGRPDPGGRTPRSQGGLPQGGGDRSGVRPARTARPRGPRVRRTVHLGAGASDRHVLRLLDAARSALGDAETELRAKVMARMAAAMRDQADREPRAALSEEALAIARRLGEPSTLVFALSAHYAAIMAPDLIDQRLELADELQHVAERARDKERVLEAYLFRAVAFQELGDIAGCGRQVQAMQRLAWELRQPPQEWLVAVCKATLCLSEGPLDEAERLAAEALRPGERSMTWDAVAFSRIQTFAIRIQTFAIRREQGRLADMQPVIQRSVEEYPTRPLFRCLLAILFCELGQWEKTRRIFEELASNRFADLPLNNDWIHSVCLLSEVAAALADPARAAVLYDLLRPYHWAAVDSLEASPGAVVRFLGVLSTTMSRWDQATAHFERGLEKNRKMGARPWTAHTEYDFARMLAHRDAPGDRQTAVPLLRSAFEASRDLGIRALEGKAAAQLQVMGVDVTGTAAAAAPAASGPRGRASSVATASTGRSPSRASRSASRTSRDCTTSQGCSPTPGGRSTPWSWWQWKSGQGPWMDQSGVKWSCRLRMEQAPHSTSRQRRPIGIASATWRKSSRRRKPGAIQNERLGPGTRSTS